jgi:hypothetical protein
MQSLELGAMRETRRETRFIEFSFVVVRLPETKFRYTGSVSLDMHFGNAGRAGSQHLDYSKTRSNSFIFVIVTPRGGYIEHTEITLDIQQTISHSHSHTHTHTHTYIPTLSHNHEVRNHILPRPPRLLALPARLFSPRSCPLPRCSSQACGS